MPFNQDLNKQAQKFIFLQENDYIISSTNLFDHCACFHTHFQKHSNSSRKKLNSKKATSY